MNVGDETIVGVGDDVGTEVGEGASVGVDVGHAVGVKVGTSIQTGVAVKIRAAVAFGCVLLGRVDLQPANNAAANRPRVSAAKKPNRRCFLDVSS